MVRQGLAAECDAWVASTNARRVRPARELHGDLLMEMDEPKEALIAYRLVLSVARGGETREGVAEASERRQIRSVDSGRYLSHSAN